MATASKKVHARERKTARMELRVAPSVREIIERATAVSGLAAGDLAYEGALRAPSRSTSVEPAAACASPDRGASTGHRRKALSSGAHEPNRLFLLAETAAAALAAAAERREDE